MENLEAKQVLANTMLSIFKLEMDYDTFLSVVKERIRLENYFNVLMTDNRTEERSIFKDLETENEKIFGPFIKHMSAFPKVKELITKKMNKINDNREKINTLIDKTYMN